MKIAMFDPYSGKFTDDIVSWWTNHGHEVKRELYYNPELVVWADVVWFDTCDNNLLSATNPDQALKDEWKYSDRPGAWDMHEMDLTGKKIIVRPIDIEVWQGHHAHSNMWDVVTDVIFLAPHIRDMMMADSRPNEGNFKTHTIPCGVNLNRWTFKERKPGYKIAVVAERWVSKGVSEVIQIAIKLKQISPKYKIYWLGRNNDYHWEHEYLKDMIKRNNLPIILEEEFADDLDTWLEDKQYLLSCSHKEAYGYNIAEAMAKGIRPIIHHFYGAEAIWPEITWEGIDEAVDMITDGEYDSQTYLQYLIDHRLDLESMMSSIDEVIKT